jgi:hypothetical protein
MFEGNINRFLLNFHCTQQQQLTANITYQDGYILESLLLKHYINLLIIIVTNTSLDRLMILCLSYNIVLINC